ncbi:MAG: pentapeptide repeat-containing protein [Pirellulales bacterium]
MAALVLATCLAWGQSSRAQILRWDNGQVIPGAEGITPGPGVQLDQWNTDAHNLRFADFAGSLDLSQANFHASWLESARFTGANLAGARLEAASLAAADLSGVVVKGASLADITSRGFTQDQLKSTASYQAKDLQGVRLWGNDMTGWDFSGQNLSGALLGEFWFMGGAGSVLTNANLSGANLTGADLSLSTLTNANLGGANLSGAQCQDTDLSSSTLVDANLATALLYNGSLANANLSRANLSKAYLAYVFLTKANLSDSDLTYATFDSPNDMSAANFSGALITGARFFANYGFLTKDQLYSTASYVAKDLRDIEVPFDANLAGWDFSGQNLSGSNMGSDFVTLTDANFSGADLRSATVPLLTTAITQNTILPDGKIAGLDLATKELLAVRNFPSGVSVQDHLTMAEGGVLELRSDTAPWNSTISFQAGIPVNLGGTLELTFAKGVDPVSQLGHTLHIFDWTGVSPAGQFTVASLYDWDTSGLYTTGVVTLLAAGGAIAGDANGNGKVEMEDFDILKTHFGDPGTKSEGDANGDGRIDLNDFGLLKLNFGKSAPGNVAVPEPATWVLAILGGVWLAAGRVGRRRRSASLPMIAALLLAAPSLAEAQVLRWDNGQVIPGTEGITPGPGVNLSGWNTEGHRLSWADLTGGLDLTGANLSHSWFESAHLDFATLVDANIAATFLYNASLTNANLERSNLTEAGLFYTDLTNANLAEADLRNAYCEWPNLHSANLAGALITGIRFYTGFNGTPDQFYSTASYQTKDLHGVAIPFSNLSGWDFSGQNLTGADLSYAALNIAKLSGANLTDANLKSSNLTNSNLSGSNLAGADLNASSFTGAVVAGADFGGTQLTGDQLYSTASYQSHELQGIGLSAHDLSGWNFVGQNLTQANLAAANLSGANLVDVIGSHAKLSAANLTLADLRAAQELDLRGTDTRNAILPDGKIAGLELAAGERLVVRNQSTPIDIQGLLNLASADSTLKLQFDEGPWNSGITFSAGIPVQLGGRLELAFAPGVDVDSQFGRTFKIFDWTGVAPQGQFAVGGPYLWDTSRLYTSGEVTLVTPEPAALTLTLAGLSVVVLAARRRWRSRAFRAGGQTLRWLVALCWTATFLAVPAHAQGTATFTPLGAKQTVPPLQRDTALDLSADGDTIVGSEESAFVGSNRPFVWTPTGKVGVPQPLNPPGFDITIGSARGVSADGQTIVGVAHMDAFRGALTGTHYIVPPVGPVFRLYSIAEGVSGDGNAVAGWSTRDTLEPVFEGYEAIRWTQTDGFLALGDLPGGVYGSKAFAISGDGQTIVGQGEGPSGPEAFRWTQAEGFVGLGDLPGGDFNSTAQAASALGEVIVGRATSALGSEAFRWTPQAGMVGVGDLPGGGFDSGAEDVSDDGDLLVGWGTTAAGREAALWTPDFGMRSLSDLLKSDYGLSVALSGWRLEIASAVSGDGRTIAGWGLNPAGQYEAWRVQFVPEPGAVLLFGAGITLLTAARMRRGRR